METPAEHSTAPHLAPEVRERQRRKREVGIAVLGILIIVVLTWVELKLLGVNSYLFLGLVNLNIILLLVVLFVVGRNGVKLLLERRRNVLGSRLRTRLVLAFILLSLVPVALMFYVSAKFVQTSVDYWFKTQVEDSMEQSLEIGRSFYQSAQARVEQRGREVISQVAANHYTWGGKSMDAHLEESLREYGLAVIGVITPEGRDQNKHPPQVFDRVWAEARTKVNLDDLRKNPRYVSVMLSTAGNDLVVGLVPVDEGRSGFLVLGESIGGGLMYKLDQVVRGLDEYKKLRKLKYPWKMTLYLTLGVMSLLIVLGASWFGFRLAKEISAPVQAMAQGTERIAKGDLSVRLEDTADDELGSLVRSFNHMAEDLEAGQKRLLDAQERMAQQYEELERRGRYIEAVLDNITSGVISTDASGRIGTVNKAAEAMLGVNAEQLVGLKAQHLVHGEFSELLSGALKHLAKVPEARWTRQIELQLRERSARFLVNLVGLTGGASGVGQNDGQGGTASWPCSRTSPSWRRCSAWPPGARWPSASPTRSRIRSRLSSSRPSGCCASLPAWPRTRASTTAPRSSCARWSACSRWWASSPTTPSCRSLSSCPATFRPCWARLWAPLPRPTATSPGALRPTRPSRLCLLTPRACARCSSTC